MVWWKSDGLPLRWRRGSIPHCMKYGRRGRFNWITHRGSISISRSPRGGRDEYAVDPAPDMAYWDHCTSHRRPALYGGDVYGGCDSPLPSVWIEVQKRRVAPASAGRAIGYTAKTPTALGVGVMSYRVVIRVWAAQQSYAALVPMYRWVQKIRGLRQRADGRRVE